ncbi:class I SAM-dependent methyltransferase [Parahaliea maris]|uniref:Class I SAM-dependent methyltransferase n=1 Tax=Parahaliea maris TaxID=2716870 RepID=A0A5C9ABI8_9GAMM|nr:class I SAM-dependent methyltransferase [Parahaliea maris]TXS96691.1 class I SAM-dependent methyltransferase [Parahaliea maris]
MNDSTVAVFYIARGIDAGLNSAKEFVEAWSRHPPEHAHQLYFLAKGWKSELQHQKLVQLAQSCDAKLLDLPDTGFDFGAYFRALPQIEEKWVCLMNSYAKPNTPGWLRLLSQSARTTGNGIAGATGSWQSLGWSPLKQGSISATAATALSNIINCANWKKFQSFPNPHLRSNGLVIEKCLLEQFAKNSKFPKTKNEAFQLESGINGLSMFALDNHCKLVICGADGKEYPIEKWPFSVTFRSHEQQNLLVTDNRTHEYIASSKNRRRKLADLAWGRNNVRMIRESPKNTTPFLHNTRRTKCPACDMYCADPFLNSRDYNRQISTHTFDYWKCSECEMVFIDPIPEDISKFYSGGYQEIPDNLLSLERMAKKEAYRLSPLLRHKEHGDILEIGPWIGIFSLNAKRRGFRVSAIERDPHVCRFLRQVVEINATETDDVVGELQNDNKKYDAIILWHSLEHLAKPWIVIQQASHRLKVNGILIIGIPNITSTQAELLGAKWLHLDAPRHLYFWSPRGLRKLGMKNGLSVLELHTRDRLSRVLERNAWQHRIQGIIGNRFTRIFLSLIAPPLLSLFFLKNGGAGITVVFRNDGPADPTERKCDAP